MASARVAGFAVVGVEFEFVLDSVVLPPPPPQATSKIESINE
jgi:hypothetical protein